MMEICVESNNTVVHVVLFLVFTVQKCKAMVCGGRMFDLLGDWLRCPRYIVHTVAQ